MVKGLKMKIPKSLNTLKSYYIQMKEKITKYLKIQLTNLGPFIMDVGLNIIIYGVGLNIVFCAFTPIMFSILNVFAFGIAAYLIKNDLATFLSSVLHSDNNFPR